MLFDRHALVHLQDTFDLATEAYKLHVGDPLAWSEFYDSVLHGLNPFTPSSLTEFHSYAGCVGLRALESRLKVLAEYPELLVLTRHELNITLGYTLDPPVQDGHPPSQAIPLLNNYDRILFLREPDLEKSKIIAAASETSKSARNCHPITSSNSLWTAWVRWLVDDLEGPLVVYVRNIDKFYKQLSAPSHAEHSWLASPKCYTLRRHAHLPELAHEVTPPEAPHPDWKPDWRPKRKDSGGPNGSGDNKRHKRSLSLGRTGLTGNHEPDQTRKYAFVPRARGA